MKISSLFDYHNEIMLHEAIKLVHDKERNLIAAISTESDPKKASKETFRNREALKSAGFKWVDGHWTVPDSQLNDVKNAISRINKVDYIVSKLEDLQDYVIKNVKDDKKTLLNNKIQGYIDKLAEETDEAAASEEIRNYLNFFAGFHQYSFHNKLLIYIQRPDATHVASFKDWKKKGRQVTRDAKGKGIAIFVPWFPKGKNPKYNKSKDDEDEDTLPSRPVRFGVGYVFDISDTIAVTPEGEIPKEPVWWGDNSPSETADELYSLVVNAAESEGIDITTEEAMGGEKGYSKGGHINITSGVEGVAKVSTMVHEYAHELMHWRERSRFYAGEEAATNRALRELQAESVSYVVLKHYELPVEHHTKYLALWKANKEKVRHNIEIISKVAHHIIQQIDKLAENEK